MSSDEVSRKWLDNKQYMRLEPSSGLPQLIRMEPLITEDGQFIPDRVLLYIDDHMTIVDREEAERRISTMNCTPLPNSGRKANS